MDAPQTEQDMVMRQDAEKRISSLLQGPSYGNQ
jgi:hypothetical protein